MKNYKERQNRTSGSFEEIFRRALELSPGDRAILIDRLLQSLDAADREQVDAAWREEIERRMQAVDEGRVELTPGEEVLAQLRSRFK